MNVQGQTLPLLRHNISKVAIQCSHSNVILTHSNFDTTVTLTSFRLDTDFGAL